MRKKGYYWIKWVGEWKIAYWEEPYWYLYGYNVMSNEVFMKDQIDERIIERKE
jgi:hypothetical protein